MVHNVLSQSLALPAGFEPATKRLEGAYTVQLCYGSLSDTIAIRRYSVKYYFNRYDLVDEEDL